MTRFWKTVLIVAMIVPASVLVMLLTLWMSYASAQAPKESGAPKVEFNNIVPRGPEPIGPVREDVSAVARPNVGDSRIEELRRKAAVAERRSIERASAIRERLKQSEGVGDAEVKKALRAELRVVVLEAFKARHDLHAAEVASFEKQAQAMKQKLAERDANSAEIVDRRVEDLLNPNKQWNAESPAANAPSPEPIPTEWPTADENMLVIHRSETSVKVEGKFDGNEEVLLVIGDPRLTEVAYSPPDALPPKQMKWSTPIDKAGDYVVELRSEPVKIDGGATAPGLAFEVHNVPNTVKGTSYIAFTDKDPLPNGKVVIASPKTKLLLKRKTDHVIVTVGHVELPKALNVVPINIVIRRKGAASSDVKLFQSVVPANGPVPLMNVNVLPGTNSDARFVPQPTGKPLGTVLGKPIHESDINKNTSTADNLKRLLLQPLTAHYCRTNKLDRAEELKTKVTDERRRMMVQLFVLPAQLHRHLYEKHGGRVTLTAFGPVPVDALKKWFEEREQAKDFELTDPDLKATYDKLWMQIPADGRFASPEQIKSAFDPALTDHFIETLLKNVATEHKTSRVFPVDAIKGHIASIKQRTGVAAAVAELRKITGLDYGNGVDAESRQDWLDWWDDETSNIDSAKDGVREFVLTGVITATPNGKPIVGATVQAHVPFKGSDSGQYQLATTRADLSGRYVLALGIPQFATPEESAWDVSLSAHHLPGYVADELPVSMKLQRQTPNNTNDVTEQLQDTLERNNDTIFAGLPVAKNFKVQPVTKPTRPATGTKPNPAAKPPVPPKPQDKLPDNKADDSKSETRSNNGQTKSATRKISYSLPFNFPSVGSILSQFPQGKLVTHPTGSSANW